MDWPAPGRLFLPDAKQILGRANEKLALADRDRGAQRVLILGHRGGVQELELAATRLNHENFPREVHHVNLAVRRRGCCLEDAFAFEITGPYDLAGRFDRQKLL